MRHARGVLSAQATDKTGVRFARLAHGVVAAVEVFALLELVLEEIFLVRQFAVEAEELLLLFRERLIMLLSATAARGKGWPRSEKNVR